MATSNQNLVCDNSTLTNFKAWAQAISTFIGGTAGWSQSGDTGQVNWSTIGSVPGSNTYVYEIWQPNDGLTNFYLRIEYGNAGATNSPNLRISIGTATNGAGVLTGYVMGPYAANINNPTAPSSSITYPCYLSGAPGRLSILMWRGITFGMTFGIERSVNSSGAYTSTHVTMAIAGICNNNGSANVWNQQTLMFASGVAPAQSTGNQNAGHGGMSARSFNQGSGNAGNFNGEIPFDSMSPVIGGFDNPLTVFGICPPAAVTEGQIVQTTLYGATRTYVTTQTNYLNACGPGGTSGNGASALCVRYD
jgi:hypothetical protein